MNLPSITVTTSAEFTRAVDMVKNGYRGEIIVQSDFAKEIARFINEAQTSEEISTPTAFVGVFGTFFGVIIGGPLTIAAGAGAVVLTFLKARNDRNKAYRLPYADQTGWLYGKGYRIALNRGSIVILRVQAA